MKSRALLLVMVFFIIGCSPFTERREKYFHDFPPLTVNPYTDYRVGAKYLVRDGFFIEQRPSHRQPRALRPTDARHRYYLVNQVDPHLNDLGVVGYVATGTVVECIEFKLRCFWPSGNRVLAMFKVDGGEAENKMVFNSWAISNHEITEGYPLGRKFPETFRFSTVDPRVLKRFEHD